LLPDHSGEKSRGKEGGSSGVSSLVKLKQVARKRPLRHENKENDKKSQGNMISIRRRHQASLGEGTRIGQS